MKCVEYDGLRVGDGAVEVEYYDFLHIACFMFSSFSYAKILNKKDSAKSLAESFLFNYLFMQSV